MSVEPEVVEESQGFAPRARILGGFFDIFRQAIRWNELARTPYGVWPALLTSAILFASVLQVTIFLVAGPAIAQDLGMDYRTVAGIIGIAAAVSALSGVLIGWAADRVRRVPMVVAGSIAQGVMSAAQAGAFSPVTYALPESGATATVYLTNVPAGSLVADWYPIESRGRAFAVLSTLQVLAQVIGIVGVGFLVAALGWRSAHILLAIPLVVFGLLFLVLKEPVRGYFERRAMGLDEAAAATADAATSFGEAWRTTWSVRTVRRLFVSELFSGIGTLTLSQGLVFYLANTYSMGSFQRSLFLLPCIVSGMLGGFVGGGLVDTFSRNSPGAMLRTLAGYALVATFGIAGLGLFSPLWALELFACIAFFGVSLSGPALLSVYSQVIPPAVRAQGQQVTLLATLPGYLFATPVFALIAVNYGFGSAFLLSVPFLLIGAIVLLSAGDHMESDRRNALLAATASDEVRRSREEGGSKFLVCRGVNVAYEGAQVLFDVDFEVDEGEIVALLGTNGAGKSTLLRAISGIQEASDGAIILEGRDITHMPPHEVAARGVVHMPGGRGVFPGLTVEENLRMATWLAEPGGAPGLVAEAFELFPVLRQRRSQAAGLLSGGEQQMLSLAQAFLARPRLLMIDELSLGLSPLIVSELLEKVKEINRRGTTVVVVEQSVNVALTIAKRAVFMEKGEVKFAGPTGELLRRPDILRAVYVKGTASLAPAAPRRKRGRTVEPAAAVEATAPVLELRHISKHFGGVFALDDVSLSLGRGETVGIVGPNGSGKTTLFDIISGYQAPDAGAILLGGADVTALSPDERARRHMVRRFQDARLFPALTVFETLLVALDQQMEVRSAGLSALQLPAARRAERRVRARADRLIELLDLGAYRDKFTRELSTGLRRIVDLACVLASEPRVLLLDEPSSGMAQAESESLGPLINRVRHETGCSILVVEHDIPLVTAVSDRVIAMVLGQVVVEGTADAVMNDARVVEAFLGGSEAAIQRSGSLV